MQNMQNRGQIYMKGGEEREKKLSVCAFKMGEVLHSFVSLVLK